MSTFDYALLKTLHHEGGLVDHPSDPGGKTYKGLSQRFLNGIGLTVEQVIEDERNGGTLLADVYKEHFWDKVRCDELHSELLSVKLFDMAVNMGPRRAVKIVQSSLVNLTVDGAIGPKTIQALNNSSGNDYFILGKIRKEQAAFYERLIARRPKLGAFRLGWLRRAAQ